MNTFNFKIKAISPLSHFSDESGSNVRTVRRMRYALPNAEHYPSQFATPGDRRRAISKLLYYIYSHIPTDRKTVRIWDEFLGKIEACASERTRHGFITRFMKLFEVPIIKDPEITELLERFTDFEFLETVRAEARLIVSEVYAAKEVRKAALGVDPSMPSLFGEIKIVEPELSQAGLVKTYNAVPCISGNSIRGTMRDMLGRDWCELTGYGEAFGRKLPLDVYHQIFTGGSITESSDYEDLEIQRKYARLIPPVGLLGTAIGNGTIQGRVAIGNAHLCCAETGRGATPCHELVEHIFATRSDFSDQDVDLWHGDTGASNQMIWHQEAIVAGAELEMTIKFKPRTPLDEMTLHRMLRLYSEGGLMGGQSARGFGHFEMVGEINDDLADEYAIIVREQAEEAQAFVEEISAKRGTKAKKTK